MEEHKTIILKEHLQEQIIFIHGIRNSDWFIVLGGDGHQPATEPGNPNIIYAQWQRGNLNRHDRITGENINIKPQPALGEKQKDIIGTHLFLLVLIIHKQYISHHKEFGIRK